MNLIHFLTFVSNEIIDHKGSVTDICFSPNGTAVYSSSTDGTVRAFDLRRYRNFRIMTRYDCMRCDYIRCDFQHIQIFKFIFKL
jgi:WD40 repeat protein